MGASAVIKVAFATLERDLLNAKRKVTETETKLLELKEQRLAQREANLAEKKQERELLKQRLAELKRKAGLKRTHLDVPAGFDSDSDMTVRSLRSSPPSSFRSGDSTTSAQSNCPSTQPRKIRFRPEFTNVKMCDPRVDLYTPPSAAKESSAYRKFREKYGTPAL